QSSICASLDALPCVHPYLILYYSALVLHCFFLFFFFLFLDPLTSEIYTLSLHDALPILNVNNFSSISILTPVKIGRVSICETAKDRKSTRLNSSHVSISYAVFCLKKKKNIHMNITIQMHKDK